MKQRGSRVQEDLLQIINLQECDVEKGQGEKPKGLQQSVVNSVIKGEDLSAEYNELGQVLSKANDENIVASILEFVMTHYIFKQGLQVYGERWEAAKTKELKQVHNMQPLVPLDPIKIADEERKEQLLH